MDKITEQYIKTESDIAAYDAGCRMDLDRADHAARFFPARLVHPHGPLYGKPYELIPWQRDEIITPIFGWVRPDGRRRFTSGYIEVPKKNNKTGICAGIVNYLISGEGKGGKKVYSAAAVRKQAAMIYEDARHMIAPRFRTKYFKFLDSTKTIQYKASNNEYRALSADADTAEGLRIYGLIFDELHVQKNRKLWRSLVYGMAAEEATDEPLRLIITTAGIYDPESVGWDEHKLALAIINNEMVDPSHFALIYTIDEDADWTDPVQWRKANPSLGITISEDEMASACKRAQLSIAAESEFKRYRLNIWVTSIARFLPVGVWESALSEPVELDGRSCYGGLDLGVTRDLSALVLVFPPAETGEPYRFKSWLWMSRAALDREIKNARAPYAEWVKKGFIRVTEGEAANYDIIVSDIMKLREQYQIESICFDKFNAHHVSQVLMDEGLEMIDFPQWGKFFHEPMRELGVMLAEQTLVQDGNPVMTWQAANMESEEDKYGKIKPKKPNKDSGLRIDGMVAMLMGLSRALTMQETESVYDSSDLMIL